MLSRLGLALSLSCLPMVASAATVDAIVQVNVTMGGLGAPLDMFDARVVVVGPVETLLISDSIPAAASGYFGSGTASAQYEVVGSTGQIRIGMNANVLAHPTGGRGTAYSYALVTLTEAFRVVGRGIVTVGMEVSAEWSSSNFGFDACSTYNGATHGTTGISFNSNCLSRSTASDPSTGLLSRELLEIAFNVPDGTDGLVDLTWRLQGGVSVGGGYGPSETGFLDAMNTANIYVRTQGDVTATPVTRGFLTDPAFGGGTVPPAVVPLPASGLLLGASILGLLFGRRKLR